jgi:hypothetical protein
MENTEENCEMICKIWKKGKLKCEMIWKICKTGKSNRYFRYHFIIQLIFFHNFHILSLFSLLSSLFSISFHYSTWVSSICHIFSQFNLPFFHIEIQKKSKLKCEMIWKITKKGKLNIDKIWKIWKKGKLNCEKI